MLVPVTAATGLAIDHARASAARSRLQDALDSAVLAGAMDGTDAWTTKAGAVLAAGIVDAKMTIDQKSFTLASGTDYGGTVAAHVGSTFSGLFGRDRLTFTAAATAVRAAGGKACILLVDTAQAPGLLMNSGAAISATSCEAHVKSTGNPATTFNAASVLDTQKTCIAGTTLLDNGGTHPNVVKGCATVSDPFVGALPVPSSATCTVSSLNVNGGSTTLSPGVYCGSANFNASPTVTLSPGVYVIKGGNWNVNGGTLSGTGVTFFFPDQSYIQFNGTVALNLSAPISGTYAGLLMYEADGLAKSAFTMNATAGARLEGLIHLPSRAFTLNSGADAIANKLTLVLGSLIVDVARWTLTPADRSVSSGAGGASVFLKR